MPSAMDLDKFIKEVKAKGYTVRLDTKHRSAICDRDGREVAYFSVSHRKGAKDFVKPCYVAELRKLP